MPASQLATHNGDLRSQAGVCAITDQASLWRPGAAQLLLNPVHGSVVFANSDLGSSDPLHPLHPHLVDRRETL